MKCISWNARLALVAAAVAAPAVHAQYTIEQTLDGGYNPWIKGQSFTPGVGVSPDPGGAPTLDLTSITLFRNAGAWSGPTSDFHLNVYDGDPVGGSGALVGSSLGTVDVSLYGSKAPMTWEFAHLTLDTTQEYWALLSSTAGSGGLDVYCGMRESGSSDPYAGGTSVAGISGDPGGYHAKPTIDLAFAIELTDTQPLTADAETLFDGPGTVQFELDAGAAHAGGTYFLGASLSGQQPGIPLPGGLLLPINWDSLTDLILPNDDAQWFFDFFGQLNGQGMAHPRLEWPGHPKSAGWAIDLAACTILPFDFVSNAWTLSILPAPTTPSKELYVAYSVPGDIFRLGKIDYANPVAVQDIGLLGKRLIYALEFAGDGRLYAFESMLWGPSQLYEGDTATAALLPIGPSGSDRLDGMAYNPVDGLMYGVEAATDDLYTIDLTTGQLNYVGDLSDDGPLGLDWYAGLAFDDEGYLHVYNNAKSSSTSEKGIWRSVVPGGLQLEQLYNLEVEFGTGIFGPSMAMPAPLFIDWSSPGGEAFGWVREADSGSLSTIGWYGYHWTDSGFGWTHYPPSPLESTTFYAWTAPPAPAGP
jgi:hypothetical protein